MRHRRIPLPRQPAGHRLPNRERAAAAEILGSSHPLVRVLDLRSEMQRQSLAAAAAIVAGTIGMLGGTRWGPPLLAAAALVLLALGIGIAVSVQVERDRARDLIIDGRGDLPLRALARERRRLARPRQPAGLARALEDVVQTAERWSMLVPTSRPIFDPRQIRAAAPELRAIVALLDSTRVAVRGVALVERLLMSGVSPLYGREPDELHRELQRIRAELGRREP